ncbi:MAG: PRTRC system protein C [Chloroflexota bacterium]
MARKFSYDSREFQDLDPTLTPEQIKQQFVPFFPELATADTREVKMENGDTVFVFERKTGTKGHDRDGAMDGHSTMEEIPKIRGVFILLPRCPWCKSDENTNLIVETGLHVKFRCDKCGRVFEHEIKVVPVRHASL